MKIETRTINGVTVLDVSGKITLAEGSVDIRKSVRDLLDSGRNQILLNLGDVKYIDSSGIGELVSSFTTVTNKGGKLKLLNLTLKIRELLAITKLLTVFECFDDEGEAVQSFS
jgi:anti-sigma B factor antagonist